MSQCIADLSIVLRVYKDNLWVANLCPVGRAVRVAAQRALTMSGPRLLRNFRGTLRHFLALEAWAYGKG